MFFSLALISSGEKAFYLTKIQTDSKFKGAYIRSLKKTLYFNQLSGKESRFTICREFYMTVPLVAYTLKNFYLLESLDKKIEIFVSVGLIDYWHNQAIDERLQKMERQTYPKILGMEHLAGCFQILLVGFILSFVVFLFELLRPLLSKFK